MNARVCSQGPVRPLFIVATLLSLTSLGCERSHAEELPVWTPQDHDHQENPAPGQVDTEAPRPGMPDLSEHGINDVILATWKQNCTPCHGLIGRGDGPKGPMLQPPDLTNPVWQKNALDSEMAHAIQKGRGRMPAFGHLPESTVKGLVSLVRMLNSGRTAAGEAHEGADRDNTQAQPRTPETTPTAPAASPTGR